MTPDHKELLEAAVGLAVRAADRDHRPFGALLAQEGSVIATGTDTSSSHNDPTAHAEIAAIRAAIPIVGSELSPCVIYASCEPCMMCTAAILRSGISAVYFAATREDAEANGYPDVIAPDTLRALIPPTVRICALHHGAALQPFAVANRRPVSASSP
jgi:tRNA(Arg) A34 adenosine deaminase TadA